MKIENCIITIILIAAILIIVIVEEEKLCGRRDAFDCARIRTQVFRLSVDCSNQLSYIGARHPFLHRKTSLYCIWAFNNFIILMVESKVHCLLYQDIKLYIR